MEPAAASAGPPFAARREEISSGFEVEQRVPTLLDWMAWFTWPGTASVIKKQRGDTLLHRSGEEADEELAEQCADDDHGEAPKEHLPEKLLAVAANGQGRDAQGADGGKG